MADLKTKPTGISVDEFLAGIPDEGKRADSRAIVEMMRRASGKEPRMWGDSTVGFGDAHLKYASGREIDWFLVGFSPRKQTLTLYLSLNVNEHAELLEKLGKHKTGVGCLYIKKLSDVDPDVLHALIERSVEQTRSLAQTSD